MLSLLFLAILLQTPCFERERLQCYQSWDRQGPDLCLNSYWLKKRGLFSPTQSFPGFGASWDLYINCLLWQLNWEGVTSTSLLRCILITSLPSSDWLLAGIAIKSHQGSFQTPTAFIKTDQKDGLSNSTGFHLTSPSKKWQILAKSSCGKLGTQLADGGFCAYLLQILQTQTS